MEWVKAENERALAAIAGPTGKPEDDPMFAKLRAIYDDKRKIPNVRLRGDFVYNFWQDEHHVKGIWRRTTMDDFKTPEPTWETVLDVDALAAAAEEELGLERPQFLDYGPGDDADRVDRCVVNLSDGGTDACTVREFDVVAKAFVDGPNAFVLPPGKNSFCWVDRDVAWIGHDFGAGTMSPSGYPLTVREWRRGQPRRMRWRSGGASPGTSSRPAARIGTRDTGTRCGTGPRLFTTRFGSSLTRTDRQRWSTWTSPPTFRSPRSRTTW